MQWLLGQPQSKKNLIPDFHQIFRSQSFENIAKLCFGVSKPTRIFDERLENLNHDLGILDIIRTDLIGLGDDFCKLSDRRLDKDKNILP
jgi:hypothetical protein